MAWTTPRDWTSGEIVTEAMMDTHVRDNLLHLYDVGGAAVYRKTTEKDIVNTTTETDLLNGEVTVAAGVMSTNKMLRAVLVGDYLNNSGSQPNQTVKIKLGATDLWVGTVTAAAVQAARRAWRIEFTVANLASASSQFMEGALVIGEGTPTTGVGNVGAGGSPSRYGEIGTNGTTAVNTGNAALLEVTVTHAVAHASLSWRLKYARVSVE